MSRRTLIDVRASALAGALVALVLLVGRWSPTRILGGEPTEYLRPRTWFVAALLLLSLAMPARSNRAGPGPSTAVGALATATLLWELAAWSWSPDVIGAFPKAYEILLVLVTVACTFRVLRTGSILAFQQGFWAALMTLCGTMALGAMVSAAGGTGRLAVFGGGPNVFGRNMGILSVLALGRALRGRHLQWWTPVAALGALLVVLSGSRGAMVSTMAAVVVLIAASRVRVRTVWTAGVVLAAIAAAVLAWTDLGHRAIASAHDRFVLLVLKERYLAGREFAYANALDIVRHAPLRGGGLASFRLWGYGVYPHNILLEIACDSGAIGLMLFGAMLLSAMRSAMRARWPHPIAAGVATLYLLSAQVSGDLYDARGVFVLCLLVGLPAPDPWRPDWGRSGRIGVPGRAPAIASSATATGASGRWSDGSFRWLAGASER